jgi:exopolysaccharide production protein ExoQ
MKQIFLELIEPITGFLLAITVIVLGCVFIGLIEAKKPIQSIEKTFLVIFLTIISGNTIFPFALLNPVSLTLEKSNLVSFTVISQFLFYSLVIFLLRSQLRYLYPSIFFLIKTPYLSGSLLLTVVSALWSETPIVTFKASLVLLSLAIFATYIAFRYRLHEISQLLRWTGTLICLSGAFVSILLPAIGTSAEKNGGWNGILAHPNGFGAWMAFTSALWCLKAMVDPKHRWLSVILSMLSLLVMFRTQSGSSIIVALTMFSVLGVFEIFKHLKFRQAIVMLIFTMIFAIFLAIFISIGKEFILGLLNKDVTLSGRTDFWPEVIRSILQRPILGYGYEGFWQAWRGVDNPAAHIINPNGFVPTTSHNSYLELALHLGIVGIVSFVLSVITNLMRIPFRRNTDAKIALLILIFVLMPGLSETGFWGMTHSTFIYVFLSVRLGIDAVNIKKQKQTQRRMKMSST